jgi:hypothetical protein
MLDRAGDILTLKTVKSANGISDATAASIVVQGPRDPIQPVLYVRAPGACPSLPIPCQQGMCQNKAFAAMFDDAR